MSVVVENPANQNMKLGNYTSGVINPSDFCYNPVLFSDYECTKQFHQMERDVYQQTHKNRKIGKSKKMPKSVFVFLTLAIAIPLVIFSGAKGVKLLEKIFKKKP